MPLPATAAVSSSLILIELGGVIIGLALLARIATRWGFSAIPLYLLSGLAFGNGGLLPLDLSRSFIHVGSEIGVVLLLFMLGLEYTGREMLENLRGGLPSGIIDFILNFPPGLIMGLLLGWRPITAILLGGATYISSSGVIAKVLGELNRSNNPETPSILAILVLEDMAMAVYLPLVTVFIAGSGIASGLISVSVALVVVIAVLALVIRYGPSISQSISHESDEVILLTILGVVLLGSGLAERVQVSAAVGAFLAGIALSGPVVDRAHKQLAPLRDLFAATFFLFFGLQIDPKSLPPVLPLALALAAVTALTKLATGWLAAKRAGISTAGRWRAGAALVARGEFSIVIAGLGVAAGLEPMLGSLSASYVLLLAIAGPILARFINPKEVEKTASATTIHT